MRHLTYTGVNAGSYLCGRYTSRLGEGATGRREAGDTSSHYAYTSDAVIALPDTCPNCREVATSD